MKPNGHMEVGDLTEGDITLTVRTDRRNRVVQIDFSTPIQAFTLSILGAGELMALLGKARAHLHERVEREGD